MFYLCMLRNNFFFSFIQFVFFFVCLFFFFFFFFFFSSRRRHTRSTRDWSSDVCSSDLARRHAPQPWGREFRRSHSRAERPRAPVAGNRPRVRASARPQVSASQHRSEERRVGKECRSRWWPYHEKKKKEGDADVRQRDRS